MYIYTKRMLCIPLTARRTSIYILKQLAVSEKLSTTCRKRNPSYFGQFPKIVQSLEKLVVTGILERRRARRRSPIICSDQITEPGVEVDHPPNSKWSRQSALSKRERRIQTFEVEFSHYHKTNMYACLKIALIKWAPILISKYINK